MKYIGTGLKQNRVLRNLQLSHNFISDRGFDDFVKNLGQNSSLKTIDLATNSLKFEDMSSLKYYLSKTKVEGLNFSQNFLYENVGRYLLKF
jgi:hypothetical protein